MQTGGNESGDVFGLRRARLFETMGDGVLVLPAAPELTRPGGGEVRYRPDPELFYLTGAEEPEIVEEAVRRSWKAVEQLGRITMAGCMAVEL